MYHLISILLSEPDLILETDPLNEVLSLWKNHGVQSAMILDRVSIQNMVHFYTDAVTRQFQPSPQVEEGLGDLSILFDAPEPSDSEPEGSGTHRMILAIVNCTADEVKTLLDATERLTQKRVRSQRDLMFVFPLVHVRGFPGVESGEI
ncbi:MAG: hypothetical protein AAF702_21350 [Chloroflexota bacterium]